MTSSEKHKSKKDKGKRKESSSSSSKKQDEKAGEFRLINSRTKIPLAPIFANNWEKGVREVLSSWIMKYLPTLDVVLLTYSENIVYGNKNAFPIVDGSPFAVADIEWEGVGWRPEIGSKISGKPLTSASSHISILLHDLFNASISSEHIPSDRYYFDHERPNPFSFSNNNNSNSTSTNEDGQTEQVNDYGCWIDKETNEPLGKNGKIKFTVIGLMIANSMISVRGSLLEDPFAIPIQEPPKVIPANRSVAKSTAAVNPERDHDGSDSDFDSDADDPTSSPKQTPATTTRKRVAFDDSTISQETPLKAEKTTKKKKKSKD